MINEKNLGNRLRLLRKENGLTFQEVANILDTSKSHVFELESGKCRNPSIWTLRKLANLYGYTLSGLLQEGVGEVKNGKIIRDLADKIIKLTH